MAYRPMALRSARCFMQSQASFLACRKYFLAEVLAIITKYFYSYPVF